MVQVLVNLVPKFLGIFLDDVLVFWITCVVFYFVDTLDFTHHLEKTNS